MFEFEFEFEFELLANSLVKTLVTHSHFRDLLSEDEQPTIKQEYLFKKKFITLDRF